MGLTKYKQKRDFKSTPEPTGGKADDAKLRFVIQKHAASHLHYDFRLEMEGVLKSWAVPKGPSTDTTVKRLAMMVEDHPYDYRNFEGIIPSGYGAGTVIVWDEGFYEPFETDAKTKKEQDKAMLAQLKSGKVKVVMHGKKLKGRYALIKSFGRGENTWLLIKEKDKYVSTDDITEKNKSAVSGKTLEQVAKTTSNFYGKKTGKNRDEEIERIKVLEARRQESLKAAAKPAARKVSKARAIKDESEVPTSAKKVAAVKPASRKAAAEKSLPEKVATRKSPSKSPAAKSSAKAAVKKKSPASNAEAERLTGDAPKTKFPAGTLPMLATLVDKPFDQEGWIYEVKWDGYRALALSNKGKVELKSRNDKSFNDKFYPVYDEIGKWGRDAVVDGEIVVVNDEGISDFGALQNWRSEADGDLYYYVFDILWLEGKDLTSLALTDRRKILASVLPSGGIIRMSENFGDSAIEFLEIAKKMGMEGIIAKKADSEYFPGVRTKEWLKIKANKRQEVIIGGYTKNMDTSKHFSSLLVGVMQKGKLVYTGKIGTGFNTKQQAEMLKLFKPLVVKTPPFTEVPDVNKPSRFRPNPPKALATWLKPELVCEVSFTEMTSDGVMRHPSFEGMRIDKAVKDVVLETETSTEQMVKKKSAKAKDNVLADKKVITPSSKQERKTLLNPADAQQVRKVNGNEMTFKNLSKIYWPKEKVTKRDMINYYYQVAPFILPYLKDRPQSMNRHPDGITGQSFYYKDVTGKAPEWIETYLYHSDADDRDRNYLVAQDEASLLYMASLGCIEMNPWHSTVKKPDNPDWCVIDLDPDKNTFNQVIEAAQVTHDILEDLGVANYCKTSGSTGLHIYIPLGAKYTYEQSKEFARVIVTLVQRELPKYTTLERIVKNRGGKMYLDFLQNRPQATIASAYSLRPKPGAPVSMPLHWHEVKNGLKMTDFNIYNAIERIKSEGDIFKPVMGKGIDLEKVVKKFGEKE